MAFLIDPKRSFEDLTKVVLDNVNSTFPIETDKRILRVNNVKVDTSKVDPYDFRTQKELKARGGDYVAPVTGDMELVDKESGKVLDSRKNMRLMDVPMITARHSFLLGGNEYTVDKQLRLKPGIFTREKENGELESTFNLAKGGRGFKMLLNPEDNIFKLKIQNANPDLYPILQALGVPDEQIKNAWGDKLFSLNKTRGDKNPAKAVVRAYKSIFGKDPVGEAQAVNELKGFFEGTVLSEETTQKTLGKGFSSVTPEALVHTSNKLLKVSRGEEEADDRDSLVYKHIYDVPDLIAARMESSKKKIARDVTRVMNRRDKISELFSKDLLNKPVRAFFVQGTVSSASDQQNPVSILSHATAVTSMGEGGIGDDNAITDSMRMVNPSHAGVVDAIQTPESSRIGINLNLSLGSSISNKELKNLVVNQKTGATEWVPVKDLYEKKVAFSDQFDTSGKAKKPTVAVIYKGKMTEVPANQVDYRIRDARQMFGFSSNLMPFLGSIQGNRGMMGNKMLGNAIPLKYREAPLVQVKAPTGGTFEDFVGNMFATISDVDGTVSKITDDEIVVKTAGGDKKYQIYNNFPLNGKSFVHSYPKVKVGDKVKPGAVLADTTSTKDGTLAIGTNLRVAYVPYKDGTFEDGYVISETASRKLTSEHLRKVEAGVSQDDILNIKAFRAHFPTAMTEANAKKLDEKGVIRVGQTVEPGDVVIAHLQKMEALPEDAKLGRLSKRLIKGVRNSAQIWDKETTGVVTDVVQNPDGVKVYVRTEEPMQIGDKLVGRFGNKGVCCVDQLTELLSEDGWVKFTDLKPTTRVATLNAATQDIEYHIPTSIINEAYSGPMHLYEGRRLNFCVTPNHRAYCKPVRATAYRFEEHSSIFGLKRMFRRSASWVGTEVATFTVPAVPRHVRCKDSAQYEPLTLKMDDFLELFGLFITEGSASSKSLGIAQRKSVHPEVYAQIVSVCQRIGVRYSARADVVLIHDKRLRFYFRQFGYCHEKWIPQELLMVSRRQLDILKQAVFAGDGCVYHDDRFNHTRYEMFTNSPRLADNYQELALKTGQSANIKSRIYRGSTEYIVRFMGRTETYSDKDPRYPSKESWVQYTGTVHCVDVPNHIIYVRRNGVPMWTGNSTVLPDHEMPKDKAGVPVEVLVSPSSMPGRINPAQIFETAVSKVADKQAKPIKISNFADVDSVEEVDRLLKEHKLTDKEELIDPTTGHSMGPVMVGKQYFLKLDHQVAKKVNARGNGPGYDIDLQPTKGGQQSARALDRLTWNSLIAHGARENLFEMSAYKAEQNPELWRAVQLGYPLPAPKTPFVFNKLLGYLAAGGINVRKDGNQLHLLPLTDKEITAKSSGAINEAKVLVGKNLRAVVDGLFDDTKTGGLKGTKWAHIELAEPIPNPVMENSIKTVLGLTQDKFDKIVGGELYYNKDTGQLTSEEVGYTGGQAFKHMLSKLDIDKRWEELTKQSVTAKGQKLDAINKELRALRGLKKHGLRPEEAMLISNVPVVPPVFRPVFPLPNGSLNTSPLNFLYRDIVMVNKQLKEMKDMPDLVKKTLRADTYKAVAALQGLGDPLVERGEKKISGALSLIKGPSPKEGFFQSVVFSKNQDLSGSSTVTPSTEMNMDEIMLPKKMAWDLYKPFTLNEMIRMGYKPLDAAEAIKKRTPQAAMALEKAVAQRPLWGNRAPSLHKFSVIALQPKLYDGKAIKVHPLVVGGLNMDFDGDTMGVFVPVSHKAVEESKNYFPSKLLENPADQRIMPVPSHDVMTGLYYLTKRGRDIQKSFSTYEDALKAFKTKQIEANDFVTIAGVKNSVGRIMINKLLPPGVMLPEQGLAKSTIQVFLKSLAKQGSNTFGKVMSDLSRVGATYNAYSAISPGLSDLKPIKAARDKILKEIKADLARIKTDDEKRAYLTKRLKDVDMLAREFVAANPHNSLSQLLAANGKPSFDQFKQLINTMLAANDEKGRVIPVPISRSFAEGLSISDYWAASYGARKGMMDRKLETAEPGYFAKQVISVTINQTVSEQDCKTKNGVVTETNDPVDIVGRYEAGTNQLIDDSRYTSILKSGAKTVKLRSPLTCQAKHGVCAMCYGLRENGQPARIGDNVGALAGQTITEPPSQGIMKTFHSGSVIGAAASQSTGFDRLKELVHIPKFLKDKATIATVSGKITKIEDNPAGGKNLFIGDTKHLVGVRNQLKVKQGDTVSQGDVLTDGPIKPQELLEHKGIEATQKYLVDNLKTTYADMGNKMSKKVLETVVRATTNRTTVKNPGNHPWFIAGEEVPLNEVLAWNRDQTDVEPLDELLPGVVLAEKAGPYPAGTKLTADMIKALRLGSVKEVKIKKEKITHSPTMVGVDVMAKLGRDWIAKLNTNNIERNLISGVQEGDFASSSSYNPTAPYALATGFGKSDKGKY